MDLDKFKPNFTPIRVISGKIEFLSYFKTFWRRSTSAGMYKILNLKFGDGDGPNLCISRDNRKTFRRRIYGCG